MMRLEERWEEGINGRVGMRRKKRIDLVCSDCRGALEREGPREKAPAEDPLAFSLPNKWSGGGSGLASKCRKGCPGCEPLLDKSGWMSLDEQGETERLQSELVGCDVLCVLRVALPVGHLS
jgi:hypothetical protein